MKKTIVFWFILLIFGQGSAFSATLNLVVNSVDGSNSLRLGRVVSGLDNKKELRIRISSDTASQYQVFQRVVEPVVNEKGETLDLKAIQTATALGSNGAGTLYIQNAESLTFSDQLIYTSGRSGEGDAFTVAYAVRPDLMNAAGNFSGKIAFTVRSTGGGNQDQVLMNVYLDSTSEWKTSVVGGKLAGRVHIKDTDTTDKTADYVKVSFSGNMGKEVRVYQEFENLPQDPAANEIAADAVRYFAAGSSAQGIRAVDPAPLARTKTLIYAAQKPADDFLVYFMMDPVKGPLQTAGLYTARMKFIVETDDARQEFPIDLECEVQPIFSMDMAFPPEGVSFANVLPTNPPVEKEVTVSVRTNLHKAYQVTQNMASVMVNEKGSEVKKDYFTFQVQVAPGDKGHTKFAEFSPMLVGEYPVFASDSQGDPAQFKVVYRLQGYTQMSGGSYAAPIRFSVNQN